MPYPEEAEGFQVDSPETHTNFNKRFFKLKPFGDYDVDIKIEACGVCGSDLHTISGGWGAQKFPLCVGHEIIGRAIRVGPKVTLIQEGQRVGVGAQSYSCGECKQCKNDNETYCPVLMMDTYGSEWPQTGIVSQGGYSSHVRTHEHWVFPIPEQLETNLVAPMLCAGLTAYSPLVRNGAGPGKKVGIVGLGGIGHFGIMFAKALGAETWLFPGLAPRRWMHESWERMDTLLRRRKGFDLAKYLSLMDVHGRWISVGLPEEEGQVIKAQNLIANGVLIGASHLGSRREMLEMLKLAADKGLRGWVEELQIGEEGLKEAMVRMKKGDVHYRFTMTGYDKVFG
ncbi:NADP-dependent alcohol dehydrogenase 6 [Aspergillus bombycis]|uniref:NADP-dependent alcohol dehydrogenase 6 n=1 Tax=Aspergillus bombycis TaxID=109264 RepID=A0A1F7ZNK7_9EURO|nr:NADP-dependent alcohol dehydrogenase 6 [Aspergillus bombycis]OGM41011.1 NADP-dependent alcohol dehydrogenase 6 [Aspergillus bombycis]